MKKLVSIITVFTLIFSMCGLNVAALENNSTNYEEYYDEDGNYNNPETGEFFRWISPVARSTSKEFSFKIRYSLKSDAFALHSSRIKVYLTEAIIVDGNGVERADNVGKRFTINLRRNGLSNNIARFKTPVNHPEVVDLGGDFATSTVSYNLELNVEDALSANRYIYGWGSIGS